MRWVERVEFGLLLGALLGTVSCSGGDDESNREETAPPVSPEDFTPPPSSCEVPELPAALGTERVVGTGTADSCTEQALRDALSKGGDITFDCGPVPVTIVVAAELAVPVDASLDGDELITLDGGGRTRILHSEARVNLTVQRLSFVRGRAVPTDDVLGSGGAIRVGWLGTLHVHDCAFADNAADDEGIEGGGAIYQSNGGRLTVVDSSFERNSAISGGAIDNLLSPMTIVGSTFVDNESFAGGGAVYDDGASAEIDDDVGGDIDICGCHFEGNHTLETGGAVYLWAYPGDRFLINQCSFIGNSAVRSGDSSALGGALRTGNAPLQLAGSLFADNHADVHGGAYWTRGNYPATIVNCTFVSNDAGVEGEEGGYGGAVSGFNVQLDHVTMVGNHAEFGGGAISNEGDEWSMNNSILANNTASNPWDQNHNCVSLLPGSNNLQWPAPEGNDPLCSTNAIIADPRLGELADNGGATQTIAPAADSPALDAGTHCAATDQRGEPRSDPCDLGAFEVQ